MTFAIIKTGGKQYKVSEGENLKVEKLEGKKGDKIEFDQVLLTSKNKDVKLGKPTLKSAKVASTIEKQAQAKKVIGTKFKAKKRYKRSFGHRQKYTEVKINKITT
ncbi:50S ribosomal protein L21 [Patescibacteria group bacterium]